MSLPEALLDLADAAHQARRQGHTETEIAHAAGFCCRCAPQTAADAEAEPDGQER